MATEQDPVRGPVQRLGDFEREARSILGTHGDAPDRLITLERSYSSLSGLSLEQDELFREALRALESGFFRA